MTKKKSLPEDAADLRARAAAAVRDPSLSTPLSTARRASAAIFRITASDSRLLQLKRRGVQIRARTASSLPVSVFEAKESFERNGFVVHFASDASEASEIVLGIAKEAGVRSVVKSKSMATEEIGLNAKLSACGIQVTETDLGEFIVQLSGERPAHILAPAINKTASAIARLFVERGVAAPDEVDPENPDKELLTTLARRYLRQEFLSADMGITGANFACAEEGVLIGISNEGNLRMCVSLPRIHVAVVPIEKIVRSLTDAATLIPLLTATATAQPLTSYVSLIAGPSGEREDYGPVQRHIVFLDNGRTKICGTRYESILRCVRCGACLNACPVYTTMGGHAYGATYMGPVGAVLATLVEEDKPSQLPYASSLCGACTEICPVSIPLHEMLYDLRADPRHGRQSVALRAGFAAWAAAWSSRIGFTVSTRAMSFAAGLSEKLGIGAIERRGGDFRQFAFSDNRMGAAAAKALRRKSIPLPAISSSVKAHPSTSGAPLTGQSNAPEVVLRQSSARPASDEQGSAGPESDSPAQDETFLIETFLAGLSRNGFRPLRVDAQDLERVFEDLLTGAKLALADREVVSGPYAVQVERVMRKLAIDVFTDGSLSVAATADVGIAIPICGIARTGSFLFKFTPDAPCVTTLLPSDLVVVVPASRVVPDLQDAFEELKKSGIPSNATLISGPSKTADIEMTLVNGVHGPSKVSAVIVG